MSSEELQSVTPSPERVDSEGGGGVRVEPELRRGVWRRLADRVFGYDYFVCYAWADGRPYAVEFAARLKHLGLDCFLDSDDYALSDDWKRIGAWTLRRTGQLLLIGSPIALQRPAVLREVRLFAATGRRIVGISFGGTLDPARGNSKLFTYLKEQTLRFEESPERLALGPSDESVKRVVASFRVVRQRDKRLRLVSVTAALLAILAIGASIAAVLAVRARAAAELRSQVNLAQRLAAQAALVQHDFPKRSALLALQGLRVAQAAAIPVRDAEEAARRSLAAFGESTPYAHAGLASMALAPDGRWLATGGQDTLIRLWDRQNPGAPHVLAGHATTAAMLAFSPDGQWLVSGGEYHGRGFVTKQIDERAFLWRVNSPLTPPTRLEGKGVAVGFAFLNSSSALAVLFSGGAVGVWGLATQQAGEVRWLSGPELDAKTIAVDPQGCWLAIGYRNGTARLWRQAELSSPAEPLVLAGHDDPVVRTLTFSPDGRWLVTTSTDLQSDSGAPPISSRTARLWDLQSTTPTVAITFPIRTTFDRVWQVEFSADSRWLLMRSDTPDLRVWRMPDRDSPLMAHSLRGARGDDLDAVTAAAFSPDGRYLAMGTQRAALHVWRLDDGEPRDWRLLSNANTEVTSLAYSPNSAALFAGGLDGWLRVWAVDGSSGAPADTVAAHEGKVNGMQFARDGKELWTVSYATRTIGGVGDESVRRFRLDERQLPVRSAAILRIPSARHLVQQSPDRSWIAFAADGHATKLVNIGSSGEPGQSWAVAGELARQAFSSSSRWLLSHTDYAVTLTRLRDGRQVSLGEPTSTTPAGSDSRIVDAAFSADDSRLLVTTSRKALLYGLSSSSDPTVIATVAAPTEAEFLAPGSSLSSRDGTLGGSLSLSRDGRWLLATWRRYNAGGEAQPGTAVLWELSGAQPPKQYLLPVPGLHTGIIIGEDAIVSTADGTAYVWRLPYAPAAPPLVLKGGGSPHPVAQNAYGSPDGRWLLTLSATDSRLWDLSSPRGRATPTVIGPFSANAINGSYRAWSSAQFSDNGNWLALTQKQEAEPNLLLWLVKLDGTSPVARRLPFTQSDSFEQAAFSLSGDWLATGGATSMSRSVEHTSINLWNLRNSRWGTTPIPLAAHETTIDGFVFADPYLFSTAKDLSVIKWDTSVDAPAGSYTFLQLASDTRLSWSSKVTLLRSPLPGTILTLTGEGMIGKESSTLSRHHSDWADLMSLIPRVVGRPFTAEEIKRYGSR